MTFISLVPTIECLADETVLIQAWKKTSSYIRYHNWFSDTLELDRTAINLREFIPNISAEIKSEGPLISDPIRMVPAPKSQQWKIESGGQWKPVDGNGDTAKIRPLAHVSLRDQVIATAMMMCLGDRVETRQGDPATPLDSAKLHTVVSYGNRLFSDFDNGQANQRWGSGTLYRGFYEDYQTFLTRPEDVAERIHKGHPRTLIVQSDLRQFYDRVTADLLHKAIVNLREDAGEAAFFERVTGFLKWKWSDSDLKEVDIYAKQSGIPDFSKIVLPQGLVAAGFFANVALAKFDKDLGDKIDQEILPNIKLHDVARYVDDLRFVLSAPLDVDTHTDLTRAAPGWASVCGLVITRQRPGTASGVVFLTLEDETGTSDIVVWKKVYQRYRRIVMGGRLLRVTGRIQREFGVTHLIAEKIEDMSDRLTQLGHPMDSAIGTTTAKTDTAPRARHPREQAKRLFPSRDFH